MENEKLLFSKLRQPVHVTYIAKYILKVKQNEALQILENYVKSGEIMESPLSKGYYQINDKNLS